jgi:hypothetical protein
VRKVVEDDKRRVKEEDPCEGASTQESQLDEG